MSYDLEVVTRLKPLAKHFEEFPSSAEQYCFMIDGPFTVDAEDLDEQVIASVLDPQWLTQFPRRQRLV